MENFDTNLMLFFAFALTFVIELVRFRLLRSLNLSLDWQGGWRYAYYLPFLAGCAGLGSGMAVFFTSLVSRVWSWIITRNQPTPLYMGGFFLVLLAGIIFALLYAAMRKVKTMQELFPTLVLFVLLDLALFLWKPTRFIFGGTLVLIVTSALGRLLPFSGWEDLVDWLRSGDTEGGKPVRDQVGVRLFIEAEGMLVRRGGRLELRGEEISGPADGRVETLARRLLERSRLTEIIAAQERLLQRKDLPKELPPIIAQNVAKWYARQDLLSQETGPKGKKEEQFEKEIGNVLDQHLGDWLTSLLYWHYDLPEDEVRLFVSRVPGADIKPMIDLGEYFGLFLSWWERNTARG
jgi:hypothetical protein